MEQIQSIPIEKIVESPYQGRLVREVTAKHKTDDPAMKALMESIKSNELMTPIIVRPRGELYEIIDGHRRFVAYKRLERKEIKAIVKEYDDKNAQVFSIVGNLMRQNLNLIEKALAFKKILDTKEFNQKQLSKAIGKHETFVSDILTTLEMDQRIINDLITNKTTEDVRLLRAIRRVDKAKKNKSDKQWELYQRFKAEYMTRKQVIDEVKSCRVEVSPVSIIGSNKVFSIHLSKAITAERNEELKEYLNDKMNEWMRTNDY